MANTKRGPESSFKPDTTPKNAEKSETEDRRSTLEDFKAAEEIERKYDELLHDTNHLISEIECGNIIFDTKLDSAGRLGFEFRDSEGKLLFFRGGDSIKELIGRLEKEKEKNSRKIN